MMTCMARLVDFYKFVAQVPYQAAPAAEACNHVLLLYKSLGLPDDPTVWAIKPKHHMMQELAEFMAPELDIVSIRLLVVSRRRFRWVDIFVRCKLGWRESARDLWPAHDAEIQSLGA